MKFKFLQLVLFVTTVCFSLVSCKKDEIDPIPQKELSYKGSGNQSCKDMKCKAEESFIYGKGSKQWIIYRQFINGQDITSTVAPCNLDNIITLTENGVYIDNEGPTKCDPANPQIHNVGKYTFSCEDKTISLVSPSLTTVFEVLELKPQSIKVKFLDTNFGVIVEFWLRPAKKKELDF